MEIDKLLARLSDIENAVANIKMLLTANGQIEARPALARSEEEMNELVRKNICLRCLKPLGDEKANRGVHHNCYQKLRRDNALEEAEALRHVLPPGKPGRKSSDAIILEIKENVRKKREAHWKGKES